MTVSDGEQCGGAYQKLFVLKDLSSRAESSHIDHHIVSPKSMIETLSPQGFLCFSPCRKTLWGGIARRSKTRRAVDVSKFQSAIFRAVRGISFCGAHIGQM